MSQTNHAQYALHGRTAYLRYPIAIWVLLLAVLPAPIGAQEPAAAFRFTRPPDSSAHAALPADFFAGMKYADEREWARRSIVTAESPHSSWLLARQENTRLLLIRTRPEPPASWWLTPEMDQYAGHFETDEAFLINPEAAPVLAIINNCRRHNIVEDSLHFFRPGSRGLDRIGALQWVLDLDHDVYEEDDDHQYRLGIVSLTSRLDKLSLRSDTTLIHITREEGYVVGVRAAFDRLYRITPHGFALIDERPRKPNAISRETADRVFRNLIRDYYSERYLSWVKDPAERRRRRAVVFEGKFDALRRLRMDYAPAWYNKACMQAIAGKAEAAIENLRRAFALDADYIAKARRDSDLAGLRDRESFRKLFTN